MSAVLNCHVISLEYYGLVSHSLIVVKHPGQVSLFCFSAFFIFYFYIFILFLLSVIQPQNVDDGVLTLCLCSLWMYIC